MKIETKLFLAVVLFFILSSILEIHIQAEVGSFTKIGLLSMASRLCVMIIGAAVGFRLALDYQRKIIESHVGRIIKDIDEDKLTLYTKGIRKVYNSNVLSAGTDIRKTSRTALIAGYEAMSFKTGEIVNRLKKIEKLLEKEEVTVTEEKDET